jgi:hypothetical protein
VAINRGYERAWATILDSNITTLIAGWRCWPSARARCAALRGALPGHPDLDVLGGDVLARPGQPLVRPAEEAEVGVDRPGLAPGKAWCSAPLPSPELPSNGPRGASMEFFRIRRDIPFMRHAMVLNAVSFISFAAAVFFLVTRGLNLSIEFTGGTWSRSNTPSRPTSTRCARQSRPELRRGSGPDFGSSRDVLIRVPVRGGQKQTDVVRRVFERCARPRVASVTQAVHDAAR